MRFLLWMKVNIEETNCGFVTYKRIDSRLHTLFTHQLNFGDVM